MGRVGRPAILITVGLLLCGAGRSGAAVARSGRHPSPPPRHHKTRYVPRPLPYDPGAPPTYTSYTPPGDVPLTAPGNSASPCGASLITTRGPLPGRVLNWSLDYYFTSSSPSAASGAQAFKLAHAMCGRLGPLLSALAAAKAVRGQVLPNGFAFREWKCVTLTRDYECVSPRIRGEYVLSVRRASLVVDGPVHPGTRVPGGPAPPGMSNYASTDYYSVYAGDVVGPFVPALPVAPRYFIVVGRHSCEVSAGATEDAMAKSGGIILAVGSSSARIASQPFYLRLPSSPDYRVCAFIQSSGSAPLATGLIKANF
ncbi:MAG TPA: hypothetical protein VIJ51_11210 [Solirubrobacteraceae bacterium]